MLEADPELLTESPEYLTQLRTNIADARETLNKVREALTIANNLSFESLDYIIAEMVTDPESVRADIAGHFSCINDSYKTLMTLLDSWDKLEDPT